MKQFLPAVNRSLRYSLSIAGAIACSLLIAVLWGASITTIYPFVEIVLKGDSAQTWIDQRIHSSETRIGELHSQIEKLERQTPAETGQVRNSSWARIGLLRSQANAEQKSLDWSRWFQPFVKNYAPDTPFGTLLWAVGWLLSTTILKGFLLVISSILVARVANRTVMDMRREYYRKALELDQRRIESFGTANLMTHLSHNMQMVSGGLQAFYGKLIREPLKMIACLVGAAIISWPLLLLSLVVVPAGAIIIQSLSRKMKRATQREVDGMGAVFQSLIESFGAIKTVRVFNRETTERRRFKRISHSLYRMSVRISLYDSLLRPITEVLGIISITISIVAGAYLVLNREMSIFGIQMCSRPLEPGSLLLFYSLLAGASDPGRKMSEVVNILVRAGTACENLGRAFNAIPKVRNPDQPVPAPELTKSIRFDAVSFSYRPRHLAVREFSLQIPCGQTVAIVGPNGCGKSTLANLLLRFYDPQRGRIMIDGVDIRNVHPKKLRRQMAWVTQDASLFRTSIWDNIAYGNRHADDEQIMQAAKLACVDKFAEQLPHRYETQIGDDGRLLSAGQRQRIALARAIVANPRILILDEATSNVDGRTEATLLDNLREFTTGRTTLLITHRASTLRLASRVVFMDRGRIVLDCDHPDAAKQTPEFRNLFARSA